MVEPEPELEIWVPFTHSPGLWGKRVNLLRDESVLPYVYTITLVCIGVGRAVQAGLVSPGF